MHGLAPLLSSLFYPLHNLIIKFSLEFNVRAPSFFTVRYNLQYVKISSLLNISIIIFLTSFPVLPVEFQNSKALRSYGPLVSKQLKVTY